MTQNISDGIALEPIKNRERFANPPARDRAYWEKATGFVFKQIDRNMKTFAVDKYPAPNSENQVYPAIPNTDWTACFWTGQLWLAYELTGDEKYRKAADAQMPDYKKRLDERAHVDTHDLGFLYTLSAVANWRLTGDRFARDTALKAADVLMIRYFEKAGVIQAWGNLNDPALRGRIIIDCAMNLPLLLWASQETGNPFYREAAIKHLSQANKYLIRPDASAYHTYYFDVEKGTGLRGSTAQGYADDSCWARGQAWAILGLPLSYQFNSDPELLEIAVRLANYFLNRLPADNVCYWDLAFTSGDQERDSSGAAIAACGLFELAKALPLSHPDRRLYENAGLHILDSLVQSYTAASKPESNGLLLHAVYNKPGKAGVDECCIWGDYFYLEALIRTLKPWTSYWYG